MLHTSDRTFALLDSVANISQGPRPGISAAPRLSLSDLNRFGGATSVQTLQGLQIVKTASARTMSRLAVRLGDAISYLGVARFRPLHDAKLCRLIHHTRAVHKPSTAASSRSPLLDASNLKIGGLRREIESFESPLPGVRCL